MINRPLPATRYDLRVYGCSHAHTHVHTHVRRLAGARKKHNTLKKKGMTSHARWWHTARAAGTVDGVRIIVALLIEGTEGDDRELCHCRRRMREIGGKGDAGRGLTPRGVRE